MKKISASLFISFLLMLIASCSFTTANIDDVKMCTSIVNNQCDADNPIFSTATPEIFISCSLKNAPENTDVEFAWYYYDVQKVKIDAVVLNSGLNTGTLSFQSSLPKPDNDWPIGDYEVIMTILGYDKEPIVKKFSVK